MLLSQIKFALVVINLVDRKAVYTICICLAKMNSFKSNNACKSQVICL